MCKLVDAMSSRRLVKCVLPLHLYKSVSIHRACESVHLQVNALGQIARTALCTSFSVVPRTQQASCAVRDCTSTRQDSVARGGSNLASICVSGRYGVFRVR